MELRQDAQVVSFEAGELLSGGQTWLGEKEALKVTVARGSSVREIFLRSDIVSEHGYAARPVLGGDAPPVRSGYFFEIHLDDIGQVHQGSETGLLVEIGESQQVSVLLQVSAGG